MTPKLNVPLQHNTLTKINSQTATVALLKKIPPIMGHYICTHTKSNTVSALLCHSQMATNFILPFLYTHRIHQITDTHTPATHKEKQ